jgi:hypothetical protein
MIGMAMADHGTRHGLTRVDEEVGRLDIEAFGPCFDPAVGGEGQAELRANDRVLQIGQGIGYDRSEEAIIG